MAGGNTPQEHVCSGAIDDKLGHQEMLLTYVCQLGKVVFLYLKVNPDLSSPIEVGSSVEGLLTLENHSVAKYSGKQKYRPLDCWSVSDVHTGLQVRSCSWHVDYFGRKGSFRLGCRKERIRRRYARSTTCLARKM